MREWFSAFSENHMILSLLIKIVLGALFVFAGIAALGIVCAFIYAVFKRIVGFFNGINEKLNKVCEPCGKSSNPWGMAVGLGFAAIFWFAPQVSKRGVSEFWMSEAPFGLTRYQFGGVIILGIMILFGIFTAKLRYPAVLAVKIVRIPLDLISLPFRFIYMITGIVGSITGAIKPTQGTVYMNSGAPGTVVRKGPGGFRYITGLPDDGNAQHSPDYQGGSTYREYAVNASDTYEARDGFAYLGEKNDQYRAAESGGADGYNYTVSADGSTQYFTGDYRPFSDTGATVEVHHLDEGYSPMDSD